MTSHIARRSRKSHRATAVTLSLVALATAAASGAPAQAATVSIRLNCQDSQKTFRVNATLEGSGAPTAKYDVDIQTIDFYNNAWAPKLRLTSLNKDGSVTHWPWHVGGQGRNVVTHFTPTTLQQPKGLDAIILEGATNPYDRDFICTSKVVG